MWQNVKSKEQIRHEADLHERTNVPFGEYLADRAKAFYNIPNMYYDVT